MHFGPVVLVLLLRRLGLSSECGVFAAWRVSLSASQANEMCAVPTLSPVLKMAQVALSADVLSEGEVTCSICLDLLCDPVTTPCGHNFCQGCIGGYWASIEVCTCPLCKRVFDERPKLSINRVLAAITNHYKVAQYDAEDMATGPASLAMMPVPKPRSKAGAFGAETIPEDLDVAKGKAVLCDVCSGRKQRAVSTCMTCMASYCQEHVRPHHETSFYHSHQLHDPGEAMRGRMCPTHGRLLDVYCRTDQACICSICVLETHRTHNTVSVQTERVIKQKLLSKTELDIQTSIERKSLSLADLRGRIHTVKNYARAEQAQLEHLLGEVICSVDRIRRELVGGMQEKQMSATGRAEEIAARQEAELSRMQEVRAKLEEQATSDDHIGFLQVTHARTHARTSDDHIGFLQSFEEVSAPLDAELNQRRDEPEVDLELRFSLDDVKTALRDVHERLEDIRGGEVRYRHSVPTLQESESMISIRSTGSMGRRDWSLKDMRRIKPGSAHKKVKGYMEDVTLNPVTAYPFLILSEDRKQVKRGEKLQFYRNSTQRFDVWSCVLAKEGFESGRHYWEVTVGENKDWKLGVALESAHRKGLFDMGPSAGYYALWWGGAHLRPLTPPPLGKVKVTGRLRRIGVFLDCEEGHVIFYNAKSGSELYSFTAPRFTERVMPLFGTGDKEVPLVLSSVLDGHH
ncbi:E3 ubiquitin-protein ligase TRIM39 isoform X1 [Alosa alosa]|uniref:E3 ubiquitin-protein ligase TRIM39 isoform X1 n=1 Tax=Alosa alosa TaxID=278164 RepID=UPI0020152892|nr:E3 ubiquitin-protein ligase TRIM39 isoform X1 [Alosa alosa]XP_048102607.1 E3 ubiquitin-protein ligase TRIM39 isoform X1 [Alosa alosa]